MLFLKSSFLDDYMFQPIYFSLAIGTEGWPCDYKKLLVMF